MSYFRTRALRWAAPVALVGVMGLAACGDDAEVKAAAAAEPVSNAASFQASLAAEADRYVELQQDRAASTSASSRASLAAEAERYVELQQDRAASISSDSSTDSSTDGFVPGSRHMPIR
jgi:hypothetical protein